MADLKALAESLVSLTIKEANELDNILKDEYQTTFSLTENFGNYNVVLKSTTNRLLTGRMIQRHTSLLPGEILEKLNNLPCILCTTRTRKETEEILADLEWAGGECEIRVTFHNL